MIMQNKALIYALNINITANCSKGFKQFQMMNKGLAEQSRRAF